MKITKSDIVLVAGFLLVLNVIMLWTIDVSITGIAEQTKKDTLDAYDIDYREMKGGGMTNGFWNANPTVMYHLCLYIIILTSFLFFILILHFFN